VLLLAAQLLRRFVALLLCAVTPLAAFVVASKPPPVTGVRLRERKRERER